MAQDFRKVLVSKDGDEFVATSPREYNDLVFGGGYREKGGDADKGKSAPKSSASGPSTTAKAEGTP